MTHYSNSADEDHWSGPGQRFHTINRDKTVAVSTEVYWQPIETCPRGVKVQLLGEGGVAIYSTYHGDKFFTHWAPLPKIPTDWSAA